MVDTALMLKNLAMGVAAAAPKGPMKVVWIRPTLPRGYLAGIGGGPVIAAADSFNGADAALGLNEFGARHRANP